MAFNAMKLDDVVNRFIIDEDNQGGGGSDNDNYIKLTEFGIDKSFYGVYERSGSSAPETGIRKMMSKVSLPGAKTLEESAFAACTSLETISIPNVTKVNPSAFGSCTSLKAIELPLANQIATGAFGGCAALKRIVLPKVKYIEDGAFSGCTAVEYIYLGEDLYQFTSGCFGGVPVTCKIECGFAEGAVAGFPANGGFAGNPASLDITYNVAEPSV